MSTKKPPEATNAFQKAVEATPQLGSAAYRAGLGAIPKRHKHRFLAVETSLLGSVDVDSILEDTLPNQPRWDYGIGIRRGEREHAIWVECHPAHTGNVDEVLAKLRWLKSWLSQNAPELKQLTPENGYYWISTNGCQIQPDSSHAFRLLKAGLRLPRKVLNLDQLDF